MNSHHHYSRDELACIACDAMTERGLEPGFSKPVEQALAALSGPGVSSDPTTADLTALLWCSINNDDSLDLDQLTVCEPLADSNVRIFVAIADVDVLVAKGSAIDDHARVNTTSVYTWAQVFPMLPVRLSTDLTSLNADQDRLAIVTEIVVALDGSVSQAKVYRAKVRNHAKPAYDAVSDWLTGQGALSAAALKVPGLDAQLKTQDAVAQRLRARRHAPCARRAGV